MTPAERAELSLRRYSHTIYHPVGTARMGTDAASVVDPELRVRGVAGSARGGCVGDAHGDPRPHERPRDRDRRGRRRPDPRRALSLDAAPPEPAERVARDTRATGASRQNLAATRSLRSLDDRNAERADPLAGVRPS